jgi:hypothetical protein
MQQSKRQTVICVDISDTKRIIFIYKSYFKYVYTINKKKQLPESLSNIFDAGRWDRGSVKFSTEKSCAATFTTTSKDSNSVSQKNNLKLQLPCHYRLQP